YEVDHALLPDVRRQYRFDDAPTILHRLDADMDDFDRGFRQESGGFQVHGADHLKRDGNDDLQPIHDFPVPVMLGDRKSPDDDDLPPDRFAVPALIGRQRLKRDRIELSALLVKLKILLHYLSWGMAQPAGLGPHDARVAGRQQAEKAQDPDDNGGRES